jgi:hypothetical protein
MDLLMADIIFLPIITVSSAIMGAIIFYMLLKNSDEIMLKITRPKKVEKKIIKKENRIPSDKRMKEVKKKVVKK